MKRILFSPDDAPANGSTTNEVVADETVTPAANASVSEESATPAISAAPVETPAPAATEQPAPAPSAATPSVEPEKPVELTPSQVRTNAIQEYHDASTREAKAKVVEKYPLLATIYSAANHS